MSISNVRRRFLSPSTLAIVATVAIVATLTPAALAAFPPPNPPPPPPADPAIAYLDGFSKLKVMNSDGSNATTIYNASAAIPPASSLSWSPNGQSIAFTEGRDLCRIDVSVVNGVPQGSNRVVLVSGGATTCWSPAWSPLGDEIVFTKSNPPSLLTVPATGGTAQTIYTASAGHTVERPAWSADGAFIAFYDNYFQSDLAEIRVLERATGNVTTVLGPVSMPDSITSIDWARTQNKLAYELDGDIYTLDVTAGSVPQLIRSGNAATVCWSPDDSALIVDEYGRNRVDVFRISASTGVATSLGRGQDPNWRRF